MAGLAWLWLRLRDTTAHLEPIEGMMDDEEAAPPVPVRGEIA